MQGGILESSVILSNDVADMFNRESAGSRVGQCVEGVALLSHTVIVVEEG
jgi:hypothetical protein